MKPELRQAILNWLADNPGSSREQVAQAMGMAVSSIRPRLTTLLECRDIHVACYERAVAGAGKPRRLYAVGPAPQDYSPERNSLNSVERLVLEFIEANPRTTLYKIAPALKMVHSVARKHATSLMRFGLIYVSGYEYDSPVGGRKPAMFVVGEGDDAVYDPPVKQRAPRKRAPKPAAPRKVTIPSRVSKSLNQLPASPFGIMIAQLQKKG